MKKKFSILTLIAVAFIVVLIFSGCDKKSIEAIETTTTPTEESTTIIADEQRIFEEETIKTSSTTQAAKDKRTPTGDGKSLTFEKGSTVAGAIIKINNKTFYSCIIKNAPINGVVVSGVIWPWDSETKGLKVISNDEIFATTTTSSTTTPPQTTTTTTQVPTTQPPTTQPPTTQPTRTRVPTGVGQTKNFSAGDTVIGWSITIKGNTYEGGVVLYNSPCGGTVTDGVINPWSSEITNQAIILS